ncbi:matrix metalloproteinase-20 [Scleropages formosus]|uniref:matrix metalloproteinase-20 n=1 Tax=Scleropages formosus TaxID=113540 RepID=UPI000878FC81|nr:matrix metalloproteinase-20-like [Scleropages formosus]
MRCVTLSWPVAVVLVLTHTCRGAPASRAAAGTVTGLHRGPIQNDLTLAAEYLERYYTLGRERTGRRRRSEPTFAAKVRDMQTFFGLNVTGSLDPATVEIMRTPRCGVPDVQEYSDQGSKRWTKSVISYSIGRYTSDMAPSTVDHLIGSALNVWGSASPLTFVRSFSHNADIMVDFVTREHGDSYPFDGPQGTLAHAYGPGTGIGGDTHFDDDEVWTTGSNGINLYLVAAHEFGHALGLSHSNNPESLMYPTYMKRNQHNLLSREDILNLNMLYGTRSVLPYHFSRPSWNSFYKPWHLSPRFPLFLQDKCNPNLSFDAVTTMGESTLFFKDNYLWIKHDQQCDTKEGPIKNFMPKIDSDIDAAYSVPKKSVVCLFKGHKFWTLRGSQVRGKPKPIHKFGFPKQVERLDAAVHVDSTGRTLFFAEHLYWSYDEDRRMMEELHPRNISEDFPGLNTSVSAAVHRDGFTHFFIGPLVLKYDHKRKQVVSADKANSWLGC